MRAVHQLGWGKAIVSYVFPYLIIVIIVAALTICILLMFPDAINDFNMNTLTEALLHRWGSHLI